MCGIAGIISPREVHHVPMNAMLNAQAHRGPDHRDIYRHKNCTLGHLRLAIIDLETGDQPLFNEKKDLCIIYNGELYNYKDLRKDLINKGHKFTTQSDTEVILHGFEEYGENLPARLNGIFAFAIYDLSHEKLYLARDHFGIKPLHYFWDGQHFIFASEQKAIVQHPLYHPALDPTSLHLHLNLRYTQGENTLFTGIKRLLPAHSLTFSQNQLTTHKYWSLQVPQPVSMSESEVIEKIHFYTRQAVQRQLVSDVPIGVYLSGGMDSSTIVQKMHELNVPEINTFTLGFNEPTDEFEDADIIAKHFNTNHRTLALSFNPLADLDKVIWHAEEPKINLLQGFNMSQFVSQYVKVVLGGLGGDEIFAGYDIHKFIYPSNKWHKRIPTGLKKLLQWKSNFIFKLQHRSGTLRFDEYRRGLQMLCSIGQIEKYYLILRNVWDFDLGFYDSIYTKEFKAKIIQGKKTLEEFDSYFEKAKTTSPLDQVLFAEMHSKMVNDYLLVEDRMSMANSVEERVPFLDLDLVDFAFQIPIELKMKHNKTKYIFRRTMEQELPPKITRKKKWGFTANPYLQFKKDLKSEAEKKLTKSFIEDQGIFNYSYLRTILDHRPHPKLRWHYNFLWVVLGLAIWEDLFIRR